MATRNSTCVEVAKLVRSILRESFPQTKFSLQTHRYAFGDWIMLAWNDGPLPHQVDRITAIFTGVHRDENDQPHKCESVLFDGEAVPCLFDRIVKRRGHTQVFIEAAIQRVYQKHLNAFQLHEVPRPTFDGYITGQLWGLKLPIPNRQGLISVHELLQGELDAWSSVEATPSPTRARVKCKKRGAA